MAEFTAQIVQLEELFAGRHVIEAPSYQRAFAWTAAEAGQLLEDLIAAAEENDGRGAEDYFLGTMLFIDREGSLAERRRVWQRGAGLRTLDVVDGFQRLTTLTILLCVLRDSAGGQGDRRLPAAITAGRGAARRPRAGARRGGRQLLRRAPARRGRNLARGRTTAPISLGAADP
jgi:hypothetical protein